MSVIQLTWGKGSSVSSRRQRSETDGREFPLFDEHAMALAAVAFARARRRGRMTACTISIGPGPRRRGPFGYAALSSSG